MRVWLLIASVLLMGCDRRVAILEREYEQVVTQAEQCRIAGQIADLHLQQSNAKQYERWSLTRDTHCLAANAGV